MGVLNVTPDSFSDGGRYATTAVAVEHALRMAEEGADLIDIGGESTRPAGHSYGAGADVVSADEELRRVMPVIDRLVGRTDTPLSIDTYKSSVARAALGGGASLVNDISGFSFDPAMPGVIGEAGASAVVMHIKGTPKTMQHNPAYDDLFGEIIGVLGSAVARGREAGIGQILIDPGIGFGKRLEHNLQLIAGLSRLTVLGCPILVGPSRKSFVGQVLDLPVDQRLEGSLAACVAAILHGANVIRVHDVKEAKRAALVADAIKNADMNA
jgi:dihydropteroate synthase